MDRFLRSYFLNKFTLLAKIYEMSYLVHFYIKIKKLNNKKHNDSPFVTSFINHPPKNNYTYLM